MDKFERDMKKYKKLVYKAHSMHKRGMYTRRETLTEMGKIYKKVSTEMNKYPYGYCKSKAFEEEMRIKGYDED